MVWCVRIIEHFIIMLYLQLYQRHLLAWSSLGLSFSTPSSKRGSMTYQPVWRSVPQLDLAFRWATKPFWCQKKVRYSLNQQKDAQGQTDESDRRDGITLFLQDELNTDFAWHVSIVHFSSPLLTLMNKYASASTSTSAHTNVTSTFGTQILPIESAGVPIPSPPHAIS